MSLTTNTNAITPITFITNESELRAALWALPPEGGIVEFSGEISITSTLVLGNGSDVQKSNYNGITLRGLGSGVSEMDIGLVENQSIYQSPINQPTTSINPLPSSLSSPSKLIWNGPLGGTMIQFAGPVSGIRLENLTLDCNDLASTAIDSVRSFNNIVSNILICSWTDGYAIRIHADTSFNGQGLGGGGAPHHALYSMIYLSNPGSNASCLQIASPGGGNVNQITFNRLTAYYSPDAVGLDLGLTDHISFISCFFGVSEGVGGNSIQITPPVDLPLYNNWPQNVVFVDTPITGGIKLNGNWKKHVNPALLFYPYFTADSQHIPPLASDGISLLPLGLVSGYTDQGQRIGLLAKGESRNIFLSHAQSAPITNIVADHIFFNQSQSIPAEMLEINSLLKLKCSGRITKPRNPINSPTSSAQTFEIRFYLNQIYLTAAHVEISSSSILDDYLWHADCEVVVTGKIGDNNNKLVMRRLGGNLCVSFSPHVTSWASGIFGIVPTDHNLTAQISTKWHSLAPVGCSVVMDSFSCDMIQG